MYELVIIAVCLAVSLAISELLYNLRYPKFLGYLFAGILLGVPLLRKSLLLNSTSIISTLSEIGIVFLLFIIGLKFNFYRIRKSSIETYFIAFFSFLIPFFMGYVSVTLLGYPAAVALVAGACLSLTAESVRLQLLTDIDKLKTKLGNIMFTASMLDDIFAMMILAAILFLSSGSMISGPKSHFLMLGKVILFVVLSYLIFKLIPLLVKHIQNEKSDESEFTLTVVVSLFIAILSSFLGFGTEIGAFLAGIIIQFIIKDRKEELKLVSHLNLITMGFVIPFFFIDAGLKFSNASILSNAKLFLAILFVAVFGKILGALLVKPFSSLKLKQLFLIGLTMNSRGVLELVIAYVAFTSLIISSEVYSAIVLAAIVTTLLVPFVFKKLIKENPQIMD